MAKSELHVVFLDEGGEVPGVTSPGAPPSAAPRGAAPRTPGPDDQVAGPKASRAADKGFDATKEVVGSAKKLADVLGVGGLFSAAVELAGAFHTLYASVVGAAAAQAGAAAAEVAADAGKRAAKAAPKPDATIGPPKGSEPDFIEGEFEIKKPPERGLIVPPSGLSTNHATTKVETIGVSGPPARPPVAGAAAGAEGAAGIMARLGAVAGPLAAAFVAVTAAVVVGAVAVKKLVDVINSESQRLASLSGELSFAEARSEIRGLMSDVRRADRVGPGFAKFQDLQSQAMEKLSGVVTELLGLVADWISRNEPILQLGVNTLGVIAEFAKAQITHLNAMQSLAEGNLAEAKRNFELSQKYYKASIEELKKITEAADEPGDDPFLESFLGAFAGEPGRRRPGRRRGLPEGGAFRPADWDDVGGPP